MNLHKISARVWLEDDWWVAQAIEVNVASQGRTKEEARRNLAEALELYFEPMLLDMSDAGQTATVEVEFAAA
jgi:predicted RNase H-like HicB family nuclease